jgi:hypothetical protein
MRERRFLTRAELVRLLDEVPAKWRPLFELLAATGLRISEASAAPPPTSTPSSECAPSSVSMTLNLEAPIPHECETAMPRLVAIERRATRLEVPVDSRIERGRTPRHALASSSSRNASTASLPRLKPSAATASLPTHRLAPRTAREVVVLRADAGSKDQPRRHASVT